MTTVQRYRNRASALALLLAVLLPSALQADVVRLKFRAVLMNGTCTLSLDKNTLPLGQLHTSLLKPNTLLNVQPFTLQVSACKGSESGMKPKVKVTGDGVRQDGKWLFRQKGSAKDVGIMVFKTSVQPSYNHQEVANGDAFVLDGAPIIPNDQDHTFYAGVSCGGATGCKSPGSGEVTATLLFSFIYQ